MTCVTDTCKVFHITCYEGSEGTLSLTSALGEDGWLTPRPCRFTIMKEPQSRSIRDSIGLGAGLDAYEESGPTGVQTPRSLYAPITIICR